MDFLINENITSKEVRIIDQDGKSIGIFKINKANEYAYNRGFDLVQINPEITPPICKLLNYSKFLFDQKKKEALIEKKNRETQVDIKEIRLTYNTASNDIKIKAKKANEFIENGDKVKISLKLRGREHTEIADKTINEFLGLLPSISVKRSVQENGTIHILIG